MGMGSNKAKMYMKDNGVKVLKMVQEKLLLKMEENIKDNF